jgi:hypothetical protein
MSPDRRSSSHVRRITVHLFLAAALWTPHAVTADPSSATLDPAISEQIRGLVGQVLDRAPGTRSSAPATAFAGIAWESEAGMPCGTSALGMRLDAEVDRALRDRGALVDGGIQGKGVLGTVLRGTYQVLKTGVRLSLSVLDAQTGRVVSEGHRILRPSAWPSVMEAALPPGAAEARALATLLHDAVDATPTEFGLQIATARGANAAYFAGESLVVEVAAQKDCFVRLYHVSWETRTVTLIFPNRRERDGFLPAGSRRIVPDAARGAVFEVAPPYGVDAVVAVASATAFQDGETLDRQLASVSSIPYLAEARVSDDRAKGILAKGLVLHDEGAEASGPRASEETAPTAARTHDEPPPPPAPAASAPDSVQAPRDSGAQSGNTPAAPSRSGSRMARAVCFFTTLPGSRGSLR